MIAPWTMTWATVLLSRVRRETPSEDLLDPRVHPVPQELVMMVAQAPKAPLGLPVPQDHLLIPELTDPVSPLLTYLSAANWETTAFLVVNYYKQTMCSEKPACAALVDLYKYSYFIPCVAAISIPGPPGPAGPPGHPGQSSAVSNHITIHYHHITIPYIIIILPYHTLPSYYHNITIPYIIII